MTFLLLISFLQGGPANRFTGMRERLFRAPGYPFLPVGEVKPPPVGSSFQVAEGRRRASRQRRLLLPELEKAESNTTKTRLSVSEPLSFSSFSRDGNGRNYSKNAQRRSLLPAGCK